MVLKSLSCAAASDFQIKLIVLKYINSFIIPILNVNNSKILEDYFSMVYLIFI